MFLIKQVSSDLGITPQAIYKQIIVFHTRKEVEEYFGY